MEPNKEIKVFVGGWFIKLRVNLETGQVVSTETMPRIPGPVSQVAEYVKAEASRLVGSVPLPQMEERRVACDGCEGVKKKGEDEWYCTKCGCPEWNRSRLQAKWEMPAATCPLGKWPKVES